MAQHSVRRDGRPAGTAAPEVHPPAEVASERRAARAARATRTGRRSGVPAGPAAVGPDAAGRGSHRAARPSRPPRPDPPRRTRRRHPLRPSAMIAAVIIALGIAAVAHHVSPGAGQLSLQFAPESSGGAPTSPSAAAPTSTVGVAGASASGARSAASRTAGTSGASAASGSSASASALPTGDLAHWHQVFSEDFSTPEAEGSFPGGAYEKTWTGYEGLRDSAGNGTYDTAGITSVHDGLLDIHLRTRAGRALVAAVVPTVRASGSSSGSSSAAGQRYGRYVVRYRADAVPGYSVAWVLWPDSDDWSDGEVDFPQGPAGGAIAGVMRCPGAPTTTCLAAGAGATSVGWHTAAVEWAPSGTTFSLDGRVVGRSATTSTAPLHWVLQTQTTTPAPSATASGHVLVDWVSIYTRR